MQHQPRFQGCIMNFRLEFSVIGDDIFRPVTANANPEQSNQRSAFKLPVEKNTASPSRQKCPWRRQLHQNSVFL